LHSFVIPLFIDASLVFVFFGIGKLAVRIAGLDALSWYWRLAFIGLAGQGVVNLAVQALLLSGASSTSHLRFLGWAGFVVGAAGQFLGVKLASRSNYLNWFRSNGFLKALLVIAWVTNLAVALAPSSKIDEIHYHMVVPKRIAAEGTMNYYRLPIESSIVPQMQYQISLSPTYAMGIPEAGNVLTFGYSIVLALFIIGFVQEVSGNETLAMFAALGCCIGAYQTVWHTTEGPASFGELALVVAACGIIWPKPLLSQVKPLTYGLLITTAASLAASTKISLLPLCGIISLIACWRTFRELRGAKGAAMQAPAALLPWVPIHIPLMLWTFKQTGSFWGPVMANVLRPSIFTPELLGILVRMRVVNQSNFGLNMRFGTVELTPLLFLAVPFVLWKAFRVGREYAFIAAFFLFQVVLIHFLLPYDFRFLGGLQYVMLMAAFISLGNPPGLTALGAQVVQYRTWVALAVIVPWLIFQMYYARPFAEETFGITTRQQFREQYVALTDDYESLNRILPPDAVLYIENARVSLFDAPRLSVMTPLDLRQTTSIYRMTLSGSGDNSTIPPNLPAVESVDASRNLECGEVVYSNAHAVIEAYRLPGAIPKRGTVTVQSCRIEPAARNANAPTH
jgi:hypothetical protein